MSNSERRLAHIELIEWIKPIEDADNIELCGVLGWQCVIAKKDNFKVGDKVIYIEIDSVVPETEQFEFLRNRKFRVRTIKLKKQISQGLVIPIPEEMKNKLSLEIGKDVTEYLGITKYLSPSEMSEIEQENQKIKFEKNKFKKFLLKYSWFRKWFLSRKQKSGFPWFVSKTDEERIQNTPKVLDTFKYSQVYITEKIDYQSVTFTGLNIPRFTWLGRFSPKKYKFIVCSRNFITNDKSSLYWKIAEQYTIEDILKRNPTLTIQGEQGFTGVQGNKYNLKEPKMWVFNIYDHVKKYHYDYNEMKEFCDRYLLDIVPLVGTGKLSDFGSTVEEIVNYSKGKSVVNKTIEREGIVVRVVAGGSKLLSFKCINPNFLLKYNE